VLDWENDRLSDASAHEWLGDLLDALGNAYFVDLADLRLEIRLARRLRQILTALADLDFNFLLRPEDVESILVALAEQIPPTQQDIFQSLPPASTLDSARVCPTWIVRLVLCKAALRLGWDVSSLLGAMIVVASREEFRLSLEIRRRCNATI
jgi:small-conductance mechanosensitive channel